MRRFFFIICLVVSQCIASQQVSDTLSLSVENTRLREVLASISDQTGLRFYYLDSWLEGKTVSLRLRGVTVQEALQAVFMDTEINVHFMREGRVILTPNDIIYAELPQGFFQTRPDTLKLQQAQGRPPAPIFNEKAKVTGIRKMIVVRIGKGTDLSANERFTLSGYARKAGTGEVLSNLAIVVAGNGSGTSTDQEGYYELELEAGKHLIRTRSLGIQDTEREVFLYGNGQLDFELSESVEYLDEVIVEADAARNVEEAVTGKATVDSDKSKNIPLILGERDVLQVAKTLPGISSAGEGASGFNVRGGKTDQNLVLLDDAVLYNPTHFFGIFQALNPFTISTVDIYKASVPAEYGDKLSSVLDIKTKEADTSKLAGAGSLGPVTANLALEIPVANQRGSLILGGRGAYSDWILRNLDNHELQNSEASFLDVIAKYTHTLSERDELRMTAYFSQDNYNVTRDSLYDYHNLLFSLKWAHAFNENHNGALILSHSNYGFGIRYRAEGNQNFNFGYGIDETQGKLKFRSRFTEKLALVYGASSKLYRIRPGTLAPGDSQSVIQSDKLSGEKGLESAAFLSGEIALTDRFLLDMGVRYSLFEALGPSNTNIYAENAPKSENTVTDTLVFGKNERIKRYSGPQIRASARYLLSRGLSVKAGYNRTYQFIHTLSNNTTASPVDTWKLSDYHLKPQNAHQFALGFYKNLKENEYEISLEGYYKILDEIIDFKTGAQLLMNDNIETEVLQGEGKAYGIEFLIRKNRGRLNGWLGYTWSRSLYKFDGAFSEEQINNGLFFPSNFDKPHDFSLIANYKFTQRYSASLNFMYQTGRPVTYPVGNYTYKDQEYVYYSKRNAFRIPDYYRLDIGFNIEGNHKIKKFSHSFWTISIYNVLGRNNPYAVFFVTEEGNVKAYKSSVFAIPIPSITYNFRF